jgi:hypothetical protein
VEPGRLRVLLDARDNYSPVSRPDDLRWCARRSTYSPAVSLLWANIGRVLLARDISGVSQQTVQYSAEALEYIG